jgi:iron complex transport system substrate-binding protein
MRIKGIDGEGGSPVEGVGIPLGRRAFVKMMGAGLLVTLIPATLSGCEAISDALSGVNSAVTGERTVTDDAGRELKIPTADKLVKIYFTSGLAQIFCFTLKPDLLAGTSIQFTSAELAYLPASTSDLTYMGSLSDNGEIDREALLVEGVQVVFSISSVELSASDISQAEDLQGQTNIPVVCLDGSFDKVAACYRTLGTILGEEKRGEELGAYCEQIYDEVTSAVATIPDDERITLYYAEGPLGLQTEPDASQHAKAFAVAGAINVAAVDVLEGVGMSNVSLEQVLSWNPEVIIAWDFEIRGGADDIIRKDADWSRIRAVKSGRVYTMPNVPFAWCDRPPGVNRFIGIQWIANMLYPDAYDIDMVERLKEFYSKFYWVDVSDDEAKGFLGNSYPPYGKG